LKLRTLLFTMTWSDFQKRRFATTAILNMVAGCLI